jgi:hypothetical protein
MPMIGLMALAERSIKPQRITNVLSHCDFPGPSELGAINPHAVHDHGQPTRQRHDLLHPAMPGNDLLGARGVPDTGGLVR